MNPLDDLRPAPAATNSLSLESKSGSHARQIPTEAEEPAA